SRHSGWIYHVCRRNLRDAHQAEDATQAVFLLLARKASVIKAETHLAGWLFHTCRYVLADLRKHHARYRRRLETACEMAVKRFSGAAHAEVPPELSVALDEAIAALREGDRQVILMHFYEGLTVPQIAVQLSISQDGAKKRVTRALSRLRKQLADRVKVIGRGKGMALPLSALLALLHAGGAEAAPAGLAAAVAKAATVPGLSSMLAEMIVAGVRQATIHATTKLLATLAVTAAPLVVAVSVSPPLSPGRSGDASVPPAVTSHAAQLAVAVSPASYSSGVPARTGSPGVLAGYPRGLSLLPEAKPPSNRPTNQPEVTPSTPSTVRPPLAVKTTGLVTANGGANPPGRLAPSLRPVRFSVVAMIPSPDSAAPESANPAGVAAEKPLSQGEPPLSGRGSHHDRQPPPQTAQPPGNHIPPLPADNDPFTRPSGTRVDGMGRHLWATRPGSIGYPDREQPRPDLPLELGHPTPPIDHELIEQRLRTAADGAGPRKGLLTFNPDLGGDPPCLAEMPIPAPFPKQLAIALLRDDDQEHQPGLLLLSPRSSEPGMPLGLDGHLRRLAALNPEYGESPNLPDPVDAVLLVVEPNREPLSHERKPLVAQLDELSPMAGGFAFSRPEYSVPGQVESLDYGSASNLHTCRPASLAPRTAAVPEPSTGLYVFALGLLAAGRWRRQS
ncbi:MAG TPA: sigma-70 family RNA polymerase sigma factor, partial [Tepidisphaeraceae bacterium]|nr:sigma-70 family RNA polymerase sigma factor [Tepidisphaeraceae bacterium]